MTTDALKYLPQMGLDPSRMVGCAGDRLLLPNRSGGRGYWSGKATRATFLFKQPRTVALYLRALRPVRC